MPRFDGTGPWWGSGPGSGWGAGPCGAGHGYGRQFGFGRGPGGFGGRRYASPKNELQDLEAEERFLEDELAAIREQKAALKPKQKK